MGKLKNIFWPTTGEKQHPSKDVSKLIKQNWGKSSLIKGLRIYFVIYGLIGVLLAISKFSNSSNDISLILSNSISLIISGTFLVIGYKIDKIKKDKIKYLVLFIVIVCFYEFLNIIQMSFLSSVIVLLKWGFVLFIMNKAFRIIGPKK